MADKILTKEPGEIVTESVDFSDRLEDYEDIDSVEVTPYKLTGATPRSYQFGIDESHELIVQQTIGGEPVNIQSLDVANDVKAVLQVFETEDPVPAPDIMNDDEVDPMQKSVDIVFRNGEDQIDYLLQVDVTSTTGNMYSKEVKVYVRSE